MKIPAIGSLAAALFLVLGVAAHAADAPEAVYARYHRAAMAGDLDEMLKYWPAARRAELQGASGASREAALKMAQLMVPRAFKLERKSLGRDGRSALLIVSGPWEGGRGRLDTTYGTVRLVMEAGEWKVADAAWSTDKPDELSSPPRAAPAAAAKAPAQGAAAGASTVLGTTSSEPERKLGKAKEPCVYKPVMTAEDMERCR